MTVTNALSGTNVHEIADGIYRINTPVTIDGGPGGFSFNQYLILDDEPLLFHTGPRKMFPLVREALASVMAPDRLRHDFLYALEADECGSLNDWLAAAPQASPLCGSIAAMVCHQRPGRPARAGRTGGRASRRAWPPYRALGSRRRICRIPGSAGFLMEERTGTLLCGDLFTQGGSGLPPLTNADILGPSEAFRRGMDYFSHTHERRRHVLSAWRCSNPRPWPACMAVPGGATAPACCARLRRRWRTD
ncbi:MBL fold metallo-hydrolase [Cupriavidus basilensis]